MAHKQKDLLVRKLEGAFMASQWLYLVPQQPGTQVSDLKLMEASHPLIAGISDALSGKPEALSHELSQLTPSQLDLFTTWAEEPARGAYPQDQWDAVGEKVFQIYGLALAALGEKMKPAFRNTQAPPDVLGYLATSQFYLSTGGLCPELVQQMCSRFLEFEGVLPPPEAFSRMLEGGGEPLLLDGDERGKRRERFVEDGGRFLATELASTPLILDSPWSRYVRDNSRGGEFNPFFRFARRVWNRMLEARRPVSELLFDKYDSMRREVDDLDGDSAHTFVKHFIQFTPEVHYPCTHNRKSDMGGEFGNLSRLKYEVADSLQHGENATQLTDRVLPLAQALVEGGSNLHHPTENPHSPSDDDYQWLTENPFTFSRMAIAWAKPFK